MKKHFAQSDFLAQIEATRKRVGLWPEWMRASALVASASLPKTGCSPTLTQKNDNLGSADKLGNWDESTLGSST